MKNSIKKLAIVGIVVSSAISFSGCGELMLYETSYPISGSYSSYNPAWAPDYYDGARYYYLPDIGCFYDLSNRDFVVLRDGQWVFTTNLNAYYPSFDLYNSFVVVLSTDVYQPWRYHQYYSNHYPRYYYRDYYDHSNIPYVRGYNENQRSAIYWTSQNRNRSREWDSRNMNNRDFRYSEADRRRQQETTSRSQSQGRSYNNSSNSDRQTSTNRNNTSTRTNSRNDNQSNNNTKSQGTNYSGKSIGQPVKVTQNMRQSTKSTGNSNKNSETRSTRSSGRR